MVFQTESANLWTQRFLTPHLNIRKLFHNTVITMLEKTLLPLSLNEPLQTLENLAEFISHFGTKKVYLCHVTSGRKSRQMQKREQELEDRAGLFRNQNMDVEIIIREGTIANSVCRLTGELDVDYLTIPWKKKNVIKRSILSSPDIDLLRICSFPTLIYRPPGYLNSSNKPNTIVYATDCREADKKVLPYLKSVPFNAERLFFLHVRARAPDPETDKKRIEELTEKLNRLADQCRDNYSEVKPLLATGSIRSLIGRKSRKAGADLIVIGRNEKINTMNKMLGSTAESVPHRTSTPILIIT